MRVFQTCLKINILIAKLSWTVIIIFATVGDCHPPGQGGNLTINMAFFISQKCYGIHKVMWAVNVICFGFVTADEFTSGSI